MKHTIYLIFLLFFVSLCYQPAAQPNKQKQNNFDEGWRFHFGNAADPTKDFNYSISNIFSKSGKAEKTSWRSN